MSQKGNFIKVPYNIENDARLAPWMNYPRVNPLAVCYAVVRMMGRLGRARDREIALSELLAGIHNKSLPYLTLKDLVIGSDYFEYSEGFVTYNWERFADRGYGRKPQQEEPARRKKKVSYNFIMVPNDMERDPRLQPWLMRDHVSPEALCYTVVRMMGRLAEERDTPMSLQQLTTGLNSKNIPYSLLEDMVVNSGFFDYADGRVRYNWERFSTPPTSQNGGPQGPEKGPNRGPENMAEGVFPEGPNKQKIATNETLESPSNGSEAAPATCAHAYLKYREKEENKKEEDRKTESFRRITHTHAHIGEGFSGLHSGHQLAPKELAAKLALKAKIPADAKERIHRMVEESYYEADSLSGWWSPTLEGRKRLLEKKLYSLFGLRKSKLAEIVGRNLGIKEYQKLWPDIVMGYIQQLFLAGRFRRMDDPNMVNIYFFIYSRETDPKAIHYQPGIRIQNYVAREKEERRLTAYKPRQPLRRWSGTPEPTHSDIQAPFPSGESWGETWEPASDEAP